MGNASNAKCKMQTLRYAKPNWVYVVVMRCVDALFAFCVLHLNFAF